MSTHARLTTATGIPIYSCHPQAPLAARLEREHQRPPSPVLAEGGQIKLMVRKASALSLLRQG